MSTLLAWVVEHELLAPLGIEFLRTIVVISISAGTAQLLDWLLSTFSMRLYRNVGGYLPLLTADSAVVGIALIVVKTNYGPIESFVAGLAGGVGVLLASVLLMTLRERLESPRVPRSLQGTPILLISAGLMAMALLAFDKAFVTRLIG